MTTKWWTKWFDFVRIKFRQNENTKWNYMQLELNHNWIQIQMKKINVNWCKIIRHLHHLWLRCWGKKKALKRNRSKETYLHTPLHNLKISSKIVKAKDHIKDHDPPYTNSKFLIIGTTRTTQKALIISQLNKPNIQQWKIVLQFNYWRWWKDHHNLLFRAFQAFDWPSPHLSHDA
jgi:hypothetical protein